MTTTEDRLVAVLTMASLPATAEDVQNLRVLVLALRDPFRVQGRRGVTPAVLKVALELAGFQHVRLATLGRLAFGPWPLDIGADVYAQRFESAPGTGLFRAVHYAFGIDDSEGEVLFVDVAPPASKITVECVPDDYQAILDQVRGMGGQAQISVHQDAQDYPVVVLWPLDRPES
jgi:hypothetical protein